MSDYCTVKEVAAELRVSQVAIRKWIASGRLRADRLGDGPNARVRIPRSAVDEFVQPAAGQMTGSLRPSRADDSGVSGTIRR